MPHQLRVWNVQGDTLLPLESAALDLEARLENWIMQDIDVVSSDLLVIGRQVETALGGFIDLLCLDAQGNTAIVELKRDKTPREVTAQALDYASWVEGLSN